MKINYVSNSAAKIAVKQSIGQIFDGQQTSLLESFNAHPLHSMLSQGLNALALAHLEVFDAGIKGKDNGNLLSLRQWRMSRGLLGYDLKEHLPWRKRWAGFEIESIDAVNRIQDR